ncbi:MAG: hypothetical protein Q9172_002028 [Xanthocarpia lactea]
MVTTQSRSGFYQCLVLTKTGRLSSSVALQPAFLNASEFYPIVATSVADYLGLEGSCDILGIGGNLIRYANPTATSTTMEAARTNSTEPSAVSETNTSLKKGVEAGIALGSLAFLIVTMTVVYFYRNRRRTKRRYSTSTTKPDKEPHIKANAEVGVEDRIFEASGVHRDHEMPDENEVLEMPTASNSANWLMVRPS